ncbi:hypothetical protein TSAR_004743 [Trichomalopsis sarcophagae]|uniref:Uncharacterized protein n=1 Tax=Trichomalopsis sarcophagae TaxID=543379 RepID=A0A232FK47_9HYME|nr:hypothetical protein TSAR_004743 [Trichomalopsis sarcophagae]
MTLVMTTTQDESTRTSSSSMSRLNYCSTIPSDDWHRPHQAERTNGDSLAPEWESFRDLFRALIYDDPRLSDVARFYYLKTHVQGEAKAALDTLKLTNSNYASAWRLLESRYDHRRLVVQDHLAALRILRPLREETSTGL